MYMMCLSLTIIYIYVYMQNQNYSAFLTLIRGRFWFCMMIGIRCLSSADPETTTSIQIPSENEDQLESASSNDSNRQNRFREPDMSIDIAGRTTIREDRSPSASVSHSPQNLDGDLLETINAIIEVKNRIFYQRLFYLLKVVGLVTFGLAVLKVLVVPILINFFSNLIESALVLCLLLLIIRILVFVILQNSPTNRSLHMNSSSTVAQSIPVYENSLDANSHLDMIDYYASHPEARKKKISSIREMLQKSLPTLYNKCNLLALNVKKQSKGNENLTEEEYQCFSLRENGQNSMRSRNRSSKISQKKDKHYVKQNEDCLDLEDDQNDLCVVCWESIKCMVLVPCGHFCLCTSCSLQLKADECPLCREDILHKQYVFK